MFSAKKRIQLERRSRHVEFIAQFTTNIRHIAGVDNIVADALSRPCEIAAVASTNTLTIEDIAEAQKVDTEIQSKKSTLETVSYESGNVNVFCFRRNNRDLIYAPETLRKRIFDQLHGIAHPGHRATARLVCKNYYWPTMQRDIHRWCRSCGDCQRNKISRHTRTPIGRFPDANRFERVHTDIVVLPEVDGYRYVVSFIDRATRWVESKALKRTEAVDVAEAFIEVWVSRHGVPLQLTSDRGPQYRSQLFKEICKILGVDSVKTTSYNPRSNGIVERMQRRLKAGLRCRGQNWIHDLPFILLGLRTAVHEETKVSPAELTFGRALKVPGEFYAESEPATDEKAYVRELRERMSKIRTLPFKCNRNAVVYVPKDLMTAKKVYVRVDRVKQPLEAPYEGPYEVVKRAKKFFTIKLPQGDDTVGIDRLKPAYELVQDKTPETGGNAPILKRNEFDSQIDVTSEKEEIVSKNAGKSTGKKITIYLKSRQPVANVIPQQPLVNASDPNVPRFTSRGRQICPPGRYMS
jgi:cleavage and polyadenylation specificity factor subunit 1